MCVYLFHYICLCLSVSACISLSLSLILCLSLCLTLSLSPYLCVCLSLCLSVSMIVQCAYIQFTQDEGISSISSTEIRIWLLDCQSTKFVFFILYYTLFLFLPPLHITASIFFHSQGIAILFAVICTTVSSPIMKYGLTLLPSDSEIIPYSCGPLIDLHYEQPYQVPM